MNKYEYILHYFDNRGNIKQNHFMRINKEGDSIIKPRDEQSITGIPIHIKLNNNSNLADELNKIYSENKYIYYLSIWINNIEFIKSDHELIYDRDLNTDLDIYKETIEYTYNDKKIIVTIYIDFNNNYKYDIFISDNISNIDNTPRDNSPNNSLSIFLIIVSIAAIIATPIIAFKYIK